MEELVGYGPWDRRVIHDWATSLTWLHSTSLWRLPRWLSGKESACSAGHTRDRGLTPGSARSPGTGNGSPLQFSCLENPMDREAQQATVHSVTSSQTKLSTLTATTPFKIWSGSLVSKHIAPNYSYYTTLCWTRGSTSWNQDCWEKYQ